jgi:hypothetical protein
VRQLPTAGRASRQAQRGEVAEPERKDARGEEVAPPARTHIVEVLQGEETAAHHGARKPGALGDLRLAQLRMLGIEGAHDHQPTGQGLHEVRAILKAMRQLSHEG